MMTVPYCTPITELGGVKLPASIKAFDCRCPDDEMFTFRVPGGLSPIGSERAAYTLGLRGNGDGRYHDTTPIGASGYQDLRTAPAAVLAGIATEWRATVRKQRRLYRQAIGSPSSNGGGCYHQPLALALCNYGWSLLADRRIYAVANGIV